MGFPLPRNLLLIAVLLVIAFLVYQGAGYIAPFLYPEPDFGGTIAINPDKSIYLPGEQAHLAIAVLDGNGHTVCDADVTLEVTDPQKNQQRFSTRDRTLHVSPECTAYGQTLSPDYSATYAPDAIGPYLLKLTVRTSQGIQETTDHFSVEDTVPFDVSRTGPTRVYRAVPNTMSIDILSYEDYNGTITEYVPASFEITPQEGLAIHTVGNRKELTWNKELVQGERYTLTYEFYTPDTKSEVFELGPFRIGTWQEARKWKMANDAATGTPIVTLPFFISSETIMASDRPVDGDGFDEVPIQLNDYGNSTEKCETWDCSAWSASGTNSRDAYCSGGWNCSSFNGVTCSEYRCDGWSIGATNRRLDYCSGSWNCTSFNGNYCQFWNCTAWTKSGTNDADFYCSGQWNCTNWNGNICQNWSCTTWTQGSTVARDYYCNGVWDCTVWNGAICQTYNCTSWTLGGTNRIDVYCQSGWNCSLWNGNYCDNWKCLGQNTSGTADADNYCDAWNCTVWDSTKKVCQTWSCLTWNSGATTRQDYYCSGVFSCTAWEIFDSTPPTVANTSVNVSTVLTDESICINATAIDVGGGSIDRVLAQVVFPNGTVTNFTMSDTGCGAGGSSDTWYGVSVNAGSTAGTLYINTTFANDTFGNLGNQSPFPNLAVAVTTPEFPCMVITGSGAYAINSTARGAPNNAAPLAGNACVKIAASNVDLNCNSNSILNNGMAGPNYGIVLNNSWTNVTVRNCGPIGNYTYGIVAHFLNGSSFINNTVTNNSQDGFLFNFSGNHTVVNNTASRNGAAGLSFFRSNNNSVVDNAATSNNPIGITLSTSSNENLITSNDIYNNTQYGILLQDGSNLNNISSNTIFNNSRSGIFFNGGFGTVSQNNRVFSNRIYNHTQGSATGIFLQSITATNHIYDNLVIENNTYGIYLNRSNLTNITGNTVSRNSLYGFYLISSSNNILINNTVNNNANTGFYLTSSSNNNFTNNTVSNSPSNGFYLELGSVGNIFTYNLVLNNSYGFGIYSQDNTFTLNTVSGNIIRGFDIISYDIILNSNNISNNSYGVWLQDPGPVILRNDHFYNNTVDIFAGSEYDTVILNLSAVVFDNPYGNYQNYTNLSLNDSTAIDGGFTINWANVSFDLPSNYTSFAQKFINISMSGDPESINTVVWHWSESELSSYTESEFELFLHNASGWTSLNATPDTAGNTLAFYNLFPSGFFGILQENVSTPSLTGNLLSPASPTTLCSSDLPSCQQNVTCQYNCTGGSTCTDIFVFVEFRNNTVDLFKNISGSSLDRLRLNGSETNARSVGNLSAGSSANASFIIRGNLASTNNTLRCTGNSSNAGQFTGALWVNVSVGTFIETSINVSSLPFGNIDPGTENNPSTSNPTNFTNTENSNTPVDIYLNATNLTSGANIIPYFNLSVATGATPTTSTPLNESQYINGTSANTGYIENLALNASTNLYFYLDVPVGQVPATYNGTLVIRAVGDGVAP